MLISDISLASEVIAWICCIILCIRRPQRQPFALLSLLTLVVTLESIGYFEVVKVPRLILNASVLVQFSLYYFLLYDQMKSKKFKRTILVFMVLYVLSTTLNTLFEQDICMKFQSHSYALGAMCILIGIMMYFFQELVQSSDNTKFTHRFFFWVYAGLFIFLASDIPTMIFLNHLAEGGSPPSSLAFIYVKFITSICYYLSFIPALLWMKIL